MSFLRPEIGEVTLLVYRECACGWWCATGEGALAPICPSCGRNAFPLGGGPGQFGTEDDPRFGRRTRSLGFVAFFTGEMTAVSLIGKVKHFLGISGATNAHLAMGARDTGPFAVEHEITSQAAACELPTAPLWDRVPWYPPGPADVDEPTRGEWTDYAAVLLNGGRVGS